MTAFPTYDEKRIGALEAAETAVLGGFAEHGHTGQKPAILQPAEIFLDRSGEEIRRRTFTLTDPAGNELCLRPDMTIPICRNWRGRTGQVSRAALLSRPRLPLSARRAPAPDAILPGGRGASGSGRSREGGNGNP